MIQYSNLDSKIEHYREQYKKAKPFPWIMVEDFLEPGICEALAQEFPASLSHKNAYGKQKHKHVLHKVGQPKWDMMTPLQKSFFEELNSAAFVKRMEAITGISKVYADNELFGGGLHEIHRGGFLNVHTDFNFHPNTQKHRALNLIVYLNEDWKDEYNGHLEFWDPTLTKRVQKLAPLKNRMVLFETSEVSFHGHPDPLQLPEGRTRKSLAVYYYSDWPAGVEKRGSTNYQLTLTQKKDLRSQVHAEYKKGKTNQRELEELFPQYNRSDIQAALPPAGRSLWVHQMMLRLKDKPKVHKILLGLKRKVGSVEALTHSHS